MDVTITKDSQHKGHGILVVSGCTQPQGDVYFTLQRASDGMHLAANSRWLNTVERIPVPGAIFQQGTLYLPISPEILGEFDSLETYAISISGGESCAFCPPYELPVIKLPESTEAVLGTKSDPKPEPKATVLVEPKPESEPEPEPEPEPLPPADDKPLSMKSEDDKPAKKTHPLAIVAGCLVLALILGASSWWFMFGEKPPIPGAQDPAPTPATQQETPKESPKAEAPKVETPAPQAKAVPFLQDVRRHLSEGADPAASLAMAKPMRKADASADDSDGAFLLIEDAAQKGNAEAMYLLAQFYDPANTLPRGTIAPDAIEAINWYRQARANGIAQAEADLAALKAFLEQKAAAGDAASKDALAKF